MGQRFNAHTHKIAAGHSACTERWTPDSQRQEGERKKEERIQTGVRLNDIPQINDKRQEIKICNFRLRRPFMQSLAQTINLLVSLISINCIIITNYTSDHSQRSLIVDCGYKSSTSLTAMPFARMQWKWCFVYGWLGVGCPTHKTVILGLKFHEWNH